MLLPLEAFLHRVACPFKCITGVLDAVFESVSRCLNPRKRKASSFPAQPASPSMTSSDHRRAHSHADSGWLLAGSQRVLCISARGAPGAGSQVPPALRSEVQPRTPKPGVISPPSHHQLNIISSSTAFGRQRLLKNVAFSPLICSMTPPPCFSISELWQITD